MDLTSSNFEARNATSIHGVRCLVRSVAPFLILLLAPRPVLAQGGNLVGSGRFDVAADADDWASSHVGATHTWEFDEDADLCVASGAVRAVTTLEDSDVSFGTCVVSGLEGNELYRLSAAFRFASDQVVGRAQVEMTFYEGVGCVSEPAGGFFAGEPDFQELGWQRFASVGVSPPGTGSAEIRIALLKDSPPDPELVVFFDEVFLGPGDYLFAEDHEIGSHCRWSDSTTFE